MSRTVCFLLCLGALLCPLFAKAQSSTRAALQEKAEAASDALARCAYFIALDSIPYRWKPNEVKRDIMSVCRAKMSNYEHAKDLAWRNGKPDDDKIDLNEKPKTDEEMFPYAMLVIQSVVERYEKSLRALRR